MSKSNEIAELYPEDNVMIVSGFDECIIGIEMDDQPRAIYSKDRMLQQLIDEGMSEFEAEEYLDYNVFGAYMGEGMPSFITEI